MKPGKKYVLPAILVLSVIAAGVIILLRVGGQGAHSAPLPQKPLSIVERIAAYEKAGASRPPYEMFPDYAPCSAGVQQDLAGIAEACPLIEGFTPKACVYNAVNTFDLVRHTKSSLYKRPAPMPVAGSCDNSIFTSIRRTWLNRTRILRGYDSPVTESALLAALGWLARHQDKDGRWDIDGFKKNCTNQKCGGEAKAETFDVGTSALALLAFMRAGQTHRSGEFKKTVRKGLRFLMREQDASGRFGPCEGESWFYNHVIASQAVFRAYAMTKDLKLKGPAEKALKYILDARNPGYGWKYEPCGGKNDTSVTTWAVLALKAAENAGFKVPKKVYEDVMKWYNRVTHKKNGRTGYESLGIGSTL